MWVIAGLALGGCSLRPPDRPYVIGLLCPTAILEPAITGFQEGMKALGYVEGETLLYEYDGPLPKEQLLAAAQRMVSERVDLIVAITTPAALAAKQAAAGTDLPVLFFPVTDPVRAGLVDTWKQPAGNLTGVATGASENQRMEWFLRLLPTARRVYLPYNPDDSSPVNALPGLQETASALGVELELRQAADAEAVRAAIADIPGNVDAIFIGPDSLVGSLYAEWVAAAIARKLPLSGSTAAHVEQGMLLSYSYDPYAVGKQSAHLADQILHGVHPQDLPVETSEFFLSINLKTADAIGLEVPDEILSLASKVVR